MQESNFEGLSQWEGMSKLGWKVVILDIYKYKKEYCMYSIPSSS